MQRLTRPLWAPALIGLISTASLLLVVGCEDPYVEEEAERSLPAHIPPDQEGSCVACHPRQVMEWTGSSHNYGSGLDGTFQALEITGNYFIGNALNKPLLRQNLLCITCHAPTGGAWVDAEDGTGYLDSNKSLAQGFSPTPEDVTREIRRPEDGEDLLPPPGRAMEFMMGTLGDDVDAKRRRELLQVTFQGISCDACHKVSRPLDDRFTTDLSDHGSASVQEQFDKCVEWSMNPLDIVPPAECRRRANGQHPHDEPYVDIGISNFAVVMERDGDTRFGPFAETGKDSAVPATAHNMSAGAVWTAPNGEVIDYANMNIAVHPDGKPFEGQEPDIRPYLKSSQFCGSCHDVRLFPLLGNEPVHGEPFYRLENLYTEWFISPLNLHPDEQGSSSDPTEQWIDNPYRNPDGSAKRLVCQDCHLSLYPYAPPGVFPGEYTHPGECDQSGRCGLEAATGGARSNLTIPRRSRVTTHNMTGPDIGLGKLSPTEAIVGTMGVELPIQTGRNDLSTSTIFSGEQNDPVYDLPMDLDSRRLRLLKTTVTTSMAGTPEMLDRGEANCDMEEMVVDYDGNLVPNSHYGQCALPVKAWAMNVNGGHRVAAGFSQERQIWMELTVEDLGKPVGEGLYEVVDCELAGLEDLYESANLDENGFPVRKPKVLTTDGAIDVFNRITGMEPGKRRSSGDHGRICRGLSGHLVDKPHDETHESVGDGRLDDEDIFLHRIGNTLPVVVNESCAAENANGTDGNNNGVPDACETEIISWHHADVGFDYPERFCSNGSDKPCTGSELNHYPSAEDVEAAKNHKDFKPRVARADQFHIVGLNAFRADLTSYHLRDDPARIWLGEQYADDTSILDLPALTRDGRLTSLREAGGGGDDITLRESVTYTSDERLEVLYPFPEFPGLVPHKDEDGHFHLGERFGLVYLTNIFYRLLDCENGECEGPHDISFNWHGKEYDLHAQVHWPMTYPALPHRGSLDHGDPNHDHYHFILGDTAEQVETYGYVTLLKALEEWQASHVPHVTNGGITGDGTPYGESFTFIPFNSNHMPNNRSLQFYRPQRHYWDIRVDPDVVGPIRVGVKVWYRHFPPEFLRLMARYTEGLYLRAVAEKKACPHNEPECELDPAVQGNWFPHGPLVVEGEMTGLFPNAASIDNLRRVLLDETVYHIAVNEDQKVAGALREAPDSPTSEDVETILDNHCAPCHLDVLRHGNLILAYDEYPQWDVPGGQSANTMQDWTDNVVGVGATYGNMPLVDPGNPDGSLLYKLISASPEEFANQKMADSSIKARPMPLKMDRISQAEINVIKTWIENGAP